jgi:hypothetical protein
MMPGQDGFMTTMLAPPSYYGVPPWVYPHAGLIPQQGTQPRRPLTPSQGAENQPFVSIELNFEKKMWEMKKEKLRRKAQSVSIENYVIKFCPFRHFILLYSFVPHSPSIFVQFLCARLQV